MMHAESPPSPEMPPIEQDRLYVSLTKGSKRATQFVPNYKEFRMGHGDPLMQAKIQHEFSMASPRSKKKILQKLKDSGEIHLPDHGSPLSGSGLSDIVHLGNHEVLSIPCISPVDGPEDTEEESKEIAHRVGPGDLDHGSPLSGLGLSDIVHLGNHEVLSIPCIPRDEED